MHYSVKKLRGLSISGSKCAINMKLRHDLKLVKGALFTIVFP